MPTKEVLAHIKDFRANSEAEIDDVFTRWISTIIPSAKEGSAAVAKVGTQAEAPKDKPDPTVTAALKAYCDTAKTVLCDLLTIKAAIISRVPEIKHEDNLGVEVQSVVLKEITSVEKAISGGSKDSDIPLLMSVKGLCEYLGGRAAIEEKAVGSEKDGPCKSGSLIAQLAIHDSDTLFKLSLAYRELVLQMEFLMSAVVQNQKILLNPRNTNNRMLH